MGRLLVRMQSRGCLMRLLAPSIAEFCELVQVMAAKCNATGDASDIVTGYGWLKCDQTFAFNDDAVTVARSLTDASIDDIEVLCEVCTDPPPLWCGDLYGIYDCAIPMVRGAVAGKAGSAT